MANDPERVRAITARLYALGPVTARRMFGGHGVFRDAAMFGLLSGDTLYFKVDDGNRASYVAAGALPFSYTRRGRRVEMSYFRVPDAILDDPARLAEWAGAALEAAARGRSRRRGNP